MIDVKIARLAAHTVLNTALRIQWAAAKIRSSDLLPSELQFFSQLTTPVLSFVGEMKLVAIETLDVLDELEL